MKEDRRKLRTQKLLREALIALILEKGYDAITVQDITDRANLGRATFYLHYHDKDELLLSLMHDIISNAAQEITPLADDFIYAGEPPSLLVFQHAEANADLYRAIFGGGGLAGVLSHYRKLSASEAQSQLIKVLPRDLSIPIEIVAHYLTGALNALVIWWLENERSLSAEEMAHIFHILTTSGIQGLASGETTSADTPNRKGDP
jgi:AcrR family transcriptional regulator